MHWEDLWVPEEHAMAPDGPTRPQTAPDGPSIQGTTTGSKKRQVMLCLIIDRLDRLDWI